MDASPKDELYDMPNCPYGDQNLVNDEVCRKFRLLPQFYGVFS